MKKQYYGVKKEYIGSWTNDDVLGLVVDEEELVYLAKMWDKPAEELLDEVELLEDDEVVVFSSNGEPAMPRDAYLELIRREMADWWENADEDERSDFGTFENFIKSDMDNWIAEDQQYTYLPAWRESHESEGDE